MATIRKRGNRYHVQIRKTGYPSTTQSFLKLADARAWAKRTESEMERGSFIETTQAKATLLCEVLVRYQREVLPTKRAGWTEVDRIKLLTEELGSIRLSDLKAHHISDYIERRSC